MRYPTSEHVPRDGHDVTASELGTYAFCAKAWHLERVLGARPSSEAARLRTEGVQHHEQHGRQVELLHRTGPRLLQLSIALFVLGAVLVALAILVSLR